jgi:Flp pilus assembly protein TadB
MAISAAIFAGATAVSINEQRKQQKRSERAQSNQQAVDIARQGEEATRARRATIKEAMTKRAQIQNVAGAFGQEGSSAVVAGTQQITGDVGQNIGEISTALSLSSLTTKAQGAFFKAQQPSTLGIVAGAVQQGATLFKS